MIKMNREINEEEREEVQKGRNCKIKIGMTEDQRSEKDRRKKEIRRTREMSEE